MARLSARTPAYDTTWQHERKNFLRCRTLGHSWFEVDAPWTPEWGTPLCVRCERCGMERRDIINTRGDIGRRYYIRPDGYGLARDEWKPTRAEFRLMVLASRRDGQRGSGGSRQR
jgi:hypothetical protein